MAMLKQISGVREVLKRMRLAKTKISEDVARGLKKGGLFLQGKSEDVVPVQIGNLKNTAFTRNVGGSGRSADVVVGYTALYAAVVHEDLEKAHGKDFNVKHVDEIAKAGRYSSSLKTQRTTFKAKGRTGTAAGGVFPRGENQQAKFLEEPARRFRRKILKRIYEEAKF